MWLNKDPFDLANLSLGLPYSFSLLLFLSAHEFGHYFAAKFHRIKSTLPYYIPAPPFLINPFGTMGAVIRIKSPWSTRKSLFDVGIAGPISGFIVTMVILLYGLFTLPGKEYLYAIHPEYLTTEQIPTTGLTLGNSLLFIWLRYIFSQHHFIPPMNEIYHYPYLCVGWFGLFVTALNLIPVGQLDGGHIVYALLGKNIHGKIARVFFTLLLVIGISSFIPFFTWKIQVGTTGWLLWAFILFFFVKLDHPEVPEYDEVSTGRKILGWTIFVIFLITFTPIPFLE